MTTGKPATLAKYVDNGTTDTEIVVDVIEGLGRQNKGYYFEDILITCVTKYGGWNEARTRTALKVASEKGLITEITFKGITTYRIPPLSRFSSYQKITRDIITEEKNRILPLSVGSSYPNGNTKDIISIDKNIILPLSRAVSFQNINDKNCTSPTSSVTSFSTIEDSDLIVNGENEQVDRRGEIINNEVTTDCHQNGRDHDNIEPNKKRDFYEEFVNFKQHIQNEFSKLSKEIKCKQTKSHDTHTDTPPEETVAINTISTNPNAPKQVMGVDNIGLEPKLASTQDIILINLFQQRIQSLEVELREKQEVIDFLISLVDTKGSTVNLNGYRVRRHTKENVMPK